LRRDIFLSGSGSIRTNSRATPAVNLRFLDKAEEEMTVAPESTKIKRRDSVSDFWTKWRGVWTCCSIDLSSAGQSENSGDFRSGNFHSR